MIDMVLDALAVIATLVTLASGALLWRIHRHACHTRRRIDALELPEMFTQQLNRRLIEEHTKELKRFNERKTH